MQQTFKRTDQEVRVIKSFFANKEVTLANKVIFITVDFRTFSRGHSKATNKRSRVSADLSCVLRDINTNWLLYAVAPRRLLRGGGIFLIGQNG